MNGRIALITGATAGFGKAIAYKFAEHGWNIIITGRREERLIEIENDLKRQFGVKVLSLCFDVRNQQEVDNSIDSIPHEWRNIYLLVNNAGLASGFGLIQDGKAEDWNRMIDTNVKGLLYVSKAVIPLLIAQGTGHIINISSIAGKQPYLKGNVYSATKFAVDALSRTMRIDLLPHRIKVTNISPGAAETEFSIVRYHGDVEHAKKVYEGYVPLTATDIAETVFFAATRPPHVVLNEIEITPIAQANAYYISKETTKS